jgi:hypothetical protein
MGGPTGPSGPGGASGPDSSPEIDQFFATLESADFSIETPISEAEAEEAITLFSVVNMFLAGKSTRAVGDGKKTDVLAIHTLYYGLQSGTVQKAMGLNSRDFWANNQGEVTALRNELETLGNNDVAELEAEGKRQFNLGLNNTVSANVEFPRLFRRYVDLGNDPLLALNLELEENNPLSDKEKVNRAVDLLVELKGVLIQIVRSLSQHGTFAMHERNRVFADIQGRALIILKKLADARFTEDIDQKNPYAVLADLLGKDRDSEVAPYVALARDGGRLLQIAMEIYRTEREFLENYEREHLIQVFQGPTTGDPTQFVTTRMRTAAAVIKRYPLKHWGG